MGRAEIIKLVERYFAAVDAEDFPELRSTLTDDCIFSVETHGVVLEGVPEISGMFERLWSGHTSVQHKDFSHVVDPSHNQVASQFKVVNTELDGALTHKSNCNFFEVRGNQFSRIKVYMAGTNTLMNV